MAPTKADNIINILDKYWPYKNGLFALIILIVGLETPILVAAKSDLVVSFLVIGVSIATIFILWMYSRALPKTRKNKVGFVVSFACDNDEEAKKIKEDLILSLRRLIKAGKTGSTFQFIEIPRYIAENIIDPDDALKLRIKTKAHFLLYGRVRVREINKKEHHFIEIDGLVGHKPIPDTVSQQLAKEFSELLPRKVAIAKENDLFTFQFASEWTEIVAKYIIGIAAALSGDLVYAEQLYRDALDRINSTSHEFPIFIKLRERIPLRISELYEGRALNSYLQWALTHDERYVDELGNMLRSINDTANKPSILFLNAIYYFLRDKDVAKSLEFLNKCTKKQREATWHFNVGFLHAYNGDLKVAIQHYRNALDLRINSDLISKIEDFIYFIATNEEKKYQLFYCLGFFNWHVKGDHIQAVKDFRKFLESGDQNEFLKERELAAKWVNELNKS
jgi:tetratricopeptide (TPR) repeat protein